MRFLKRKPNRKNVNTEHSITVVPGSRYLDYNGTVADQDTYRLWTAEEGHECFFTISVPAGASEGEVLNLYNSTSDIR